MIRKTTAWPLLASMIMAFFHFHTAMALTATQVTSESDLEDKGLYFITYKATKGYYRFYDEEGSNDEKRVVYSAYKNSQACYYSTVAAAATDSRLVQLVKNGDTWLLKDVLSQKYIGRGKENTTNVFLRSDSPTSYYTVTISFDDKKNIEMTIGSYYLRTYTQLTRFTIRSKQSETGYDNILFYKISDYDISLSDATALPFNDLAGNIIFDRPFVDNYYNTLMVPFDIPQYKDVFGSGVRAYKMTEADNNKINFTTVGADETLEANTPYLLNGTFGTSPYTISNATLNSLADEDGIMTKEMGAVSFKGVYTTEIDLGNSQAFILYNNAFYICDQVATMPIAPYRWYIVKNNDNLTNDAKALFINGVNANDITAGITRPLSSPHDGRAYRIDGTPLPLESSQAPKGIYIVNGRKMQKR